MNKASDKIRSMAEQAKQMSKELNEIESSERTYVGSVLLFRRKTKRGGELTQLGLIRQVKFSHGYFLIQMADTDRPFRIDMSDHDYEVIPKLELVKHLPGESK